MKRLLRVFVFFCVLYCVLCVLPREARAQNPFTIDYSTTYLIQEDGNAAVNQTITLTNNTSETYAPSYELFLEGRDPEDIQAVEKEEIIPTSTRKQDNQTIIVVSFPKALVGKNKSRTFSIKYGLQGLATKNGQVWEVAIPKVVTPDTIDSKTLILYVPKSLGLPAYISPEPQKRDSTDNHYIFTFEKEDLLKAGVVAAFGKFQVFSFDLTYHLENPTSHLAEMKIALPPDTAFQHVFYQEISPKPKNISLDIDGNWIAIYQLGGKEKLEVKALGNVQVFADPQSMRPQLAPVGDNQLKEAKYWEVNDPEIISLGKEFKTPRNIYDFVVALLSYDYSLVNQTTARVGAKNALLSPLTSVCREFTDLFISLSRSAGIPAREVNGFAYTENPQIQPLSLVADVLHAWPEYWDDAKRLWIPVDPTWGKTTGGIDFFDKFDLNHITFAIHGANSESPLPAGAYKIEDTPQKDVAVTFGKLPEVRTPKFKISISKRSLYLPFAKTLFLVTIENDGTSASYDLPLKITGTNLELSGDIPKNIIFLAPFAKKEFTLRTKSDFLQWQKSKDISIDASGTDAGEVHSFYSIPVAEVIISECLVVFGTITAGVLCLYLIRQQTN